MCGLVGVLHHDPRRMADANLLARMTRTLAHRGPDDEQVEVYGSAGLGFRRLSVIDPRGGRQPLHDESGHIHLTGNGEIYNFRELRSALEGRHRFAGGSDFESVVHLYEEHGRELVGELTGQFAFALIDQRDTSRPRVLLARDRLGIKPLFWALDEEGLWWASEPKALLASDRFRRELRVTALLDYLVQGYVSGTSSAWPDLHRLPPGCTLEWTPGEQPHIERYWDLPLDGHREATSTPEVLDELDRAVRERLVADVPLGAFLSGGIDSSAVLTSMATAEPGRGPEELVACSVGFHERSHDELAIARKTAQRLGARHHTAVLEADPALALEHLPWFFDEPHADPSDLPTYLVSRMAREHVTVALSGDGGDEVFAGYRRYVHDEAERRTRAKMSERTRSRLAALGRLYPKLDWAPRPLRARTFLTHLGLDSARAYWSSVSQLEREDALLLFSDEVRAALADHDPFHAFEEHYHRPRQVDDLYRAQYADFHTNLPDRILAKVDRASMAASLEARVPMLDHRFVRRFVNLPAEEKVHAGRGKHRLREALRSRVDAEVLDGTKRGFDTPLAVWIRGPLELAVRDAIEELPIEWFDRDRLRLHLVQHLSGSRDHSRLLWSLLVLEHWRRRHAVRGLAG